MDKLSEQLVCKIVGECTLADIGRVRDALIAVHGDSADNMKLWDVWKAGLKRLEILEKPAAVERTPVPVEKYQTPEAPVPDLPASMLDYIVDAMVVMWSDGESFGYKDVRELLGENIPTWRWQKVPGRARELGYVMSVTGRTRYATWTIKKEAK